MALLIVHEIGHLPRIANHEQASSASSKLCKNVEIVAVNYQE